ncbi:MAG TPA: type II toxin-antitoxin system VapC family toxin [Acidobacteriota bacterium]|jgi:PIN domain nuclease of toxin-antitoxin system
MTLHVTDTHPLLWYAAGQHQKLSRTALRLFKNAENNRGLIYVPVVVLWEVALLIKKRRFELLQPFSLWSGMLLAQPGFELALLEPEAISQAMQFHLRDLFDAAIVATARIKDLPLITKDQHITEAKIIEIAW